MSASEKYENLLGRIEELGSVLVAYSGGVDSTLLAVAAHAVLGDSALAVLARSDTYPANDVGRARTLAHELGFNLEEVETYELSDPRFAINDPDRCYYCKTELYGMLKRVANVRGLTWVIDGNNADDENAHRPGWRACNELAVVSPLRDAGLTKAEVREVSRLLGLPNWDLPSQSCLATRFPYGERITEEGLARVGIAETRLRELDFSTFRIRSHGNLARVEVGAEELERAWQLRDTIDQGLREAGFTWVAIDPRGYRSGSLDEVSDVEPSPSERSIN